MPHKWITVFATIAVVGCSSQTDSFAPLAADERDPQVAVPPIGGGSIEFAWNGQSVVASDADHDSVWLLEQGHTQQVLKLDAASRPGRVAQLTDELFGVLLEGSGEVAQIHTGWRSVLGMLPTCSEPRGIARVPDEKESLQRARFWVACADGRVLEQAAEGGDVVRSVQLEPGLRDVVFSGEHAYVSVFRTAEVYVLGHDMGVRAKLVPDTPERAGAASAWRMRAAEDASVLLTHHVVQADVVARQSDPTPQYHSRSCATHPVNSALTVMRHGKVAHTRVLDIPALPLDTIDHGEERFILASGNRNAASVFRFDSEPWKPASNQIVECIQPRPLSIRSSVEDVGGRWIGMARFGATIAIQTRNPWRIVIAQYQEAAEAQRSLVDAPRLDLATSKDFYQGGILDLGHEDFHTDTGFGLTCASCHPNGGDDGVAWEFVTGEIRRTQDLRGGLLDTAPFHWQGEHRDMEELVQETFFERMGGSVARHGNLLDVDDWLDRLAMPPSFAVAGDEQAVARGKALFERSAVGCASCHSGERFTNNATVDVGTGGAFQVPSLVGLSHRPPYMHDGCAKTLMARFTDERCGGGDLHGQTSHLSQSELQALVAYLSTL